MEFKDFPLKEVGHTVLMAGAIYSGPDQMYFLPFPAMADLELMQIELVHLTDEQWNRVILQADTMETEVLQLAADGKDVVKAIVRKCERQIAQQVSWNVYKRDNFHCRYCGSADRPLTVDHLILWEEGGPSIEANLVASCRKCNKARGRMQYEEWLQSPYYRKVSVGLSALVRADNLELVKTLDTIPSLRKVRSR